MGHAVSCLLLNYLLKMGHAVIQKMGHAVSCLLLDYLLKMGHAVIQKMGHAVSCLLLDYLLESLKQAASLRLTQQGRDM
jgi:uncharacterized membrane protein YwzB